MLAYKKCFGHDASAARSGKSDLFEGGWGLSGWTYTAAVAPINAARRGQIIPFLHSRTLSPPARHHRKKPGGAWRAVTSPWPQVGRWRDPCGSPMTTPIGRQNLSRWPQEWTALQGAQTCVRATGGTAQRRSRQNHHRQTTSGYSCKEKPQAPMHQQTICPRSHSHN